MEGVVAFFECFGHMGYESGLFGVNDAEVLYASLWDYLLIVNGENDFVVVKIGVSAMLFISAFEDDAFCLCWVYPDFPLFKECDEISNV